MSRRTLAAIALLAATVAMYFIGLNQSTKPERRSKPPAEPVDSSQVQQRLPDGSIPPPTVNQLPPAEPADQAASNPANPPSSPPVPLVPESGNTTGSAMPSAPASSPVSEQDVAADLENVQFALRDFRSALGENPVGTNAEITKALTGDNLKQVKVPLPPGNQLNENGELLDRWGTPYFFHQLSGTEMEVRSAGPDRKMWTADDKQVK